jgi:hypothetical protein
VAGNVVTEVDRNVETSPGRTSPFAVACLGSRASDSSRRPTVHWAPGARSANGGGSSGSGIPSARNAVVVAAIHRPRSAAAANELGSRLASASARSVQREPEHFELRSRADFDSATGNIFQSLGHTRRVGTRFRRRCASQRTTKRAPCQRERRWPFWVSTSTVASSARPARWRPRSARMTSGTVAPATLGSLVEVPRLLRGLGRYRRLVHHTPAPHPRPLMAGAGPQGQRLCTTRDETRRPQARY